MEKLVIKIGSSSLINNGRELNYELINGIARQASILKDEGVAFVIVTSGAIASGKMILGQHNGNEVRNQVLAAVGQRPLLNAWGNAFDRYGIHSGLFLFSEEDLSKPRLPLVEAIDEGIVPIINANDTVSISEIRKLAISADNDRLASFVARFLIGADKLILLTDAQGVLDAQKQVIESIEQMEDVDRIGWFDKTDLGTGGIDSKLKEARDFITDASKIAYIAGASIEDVILKIVRGEKVGTRVTLPNQAFLNFIW